MKTSLGSTTRHATRSSLIAVASTGVLVAAAALCLPAAGAQPLAASATTTALPCGAGMARAGAVDPLCVVTSPTSSTKTSTASPTSSSTAKVFSFEAGTRDGWKPMKGVSAKVVADSTAPDGAKVLELKATKASYASVSWTGNTRLFPGTGTWYHVVLPLRGTLSKSTPTSTKSPAMLTLRVSGPIAKSIGGTVAVPADGWAKVGLWFMLDDTAGKKGTKITLSLDPGPQTNCGPQDPMPGLLAVDAITFSRTDTLPVDAQAVVRPAC